MLETGPPLCMLQSADCYNEAKWRISVLLPTRHLQPVASQNLCSQGNTPAAYASRARHHASPVFHENPGARRCLSQPTLPTHTTSHHLKPSCTEIECRYFLIAGFSISASNCTTPVQAKGVDMTGGTWRMLAVLGMLAGVSLLLASPVDAQACSPACGSHATCYLNYNRDSFCACDGYYTGNGYNCKYSTWRVVLYILSSVILFIVIFFFCLSCLGYFRRRVDQPVGYPMQPMGNSPYGYPPPAGTQTTANPAMFSYPPQTGYPPPQNGYPPPQAGYPPQTGYPVNAYPPQVVNQDSSKVPGPSGSV